MWQEGGTESCGTGREKLPERLWSKVLEDNLVKEAGMTETSGKERGRAKLGSRENLVIEHLEKELKA